MLNKKYIKECLEYYKDINIKYFVIKIEDFLKSTDAMHLEEFYNILDMYNEYRKNLGKPINKYFVINRDECPELNNAEEFINFMRNKLPQSKKEILSKELFLKYLEKWELFNSKVTEFEKIFNCAIYDIPAVDAVGLMLDTFLESHFTEAGCDMINAYLFDHLDGHYVDLEESDGTQVYIQTLDELYDYMAKDTKTYFING